MESKLKILIVEDTPSDVLLEEREIKRTFPDYILQVVETRDAFISALNEFKPDIILSDYSMPTFDGLKALQICLEVTPLTPFILVTGSVNEDTAVSCMKAGADDYIIKEHIRRLGPSMINAIQQKKVKREKLVIEKQIEENEKMYRLMFQGNPQPMFIYDTETLKIVEVNDSAIHHYGYTKDEFISKTILDIRPKDDIDKLISFIDKRNDKISQSSVWRHIIKSGEIILVEIISHAITFNSRPSRHVMVNDITEKKMIEQKLLESENRFRSLFEDNINVMLLTDPDNGQIIDANQAAADFYGWSRMELITMCIQDIDINGEIIKPVIKKTHSDKQLFFEYKHRKINNIIIDVEVFTSTIEIEGKVYLHSIIHDVTSRKEAEKLVKLLSRAIEQSPVSLMITDKEGNLVYINKKFTEVSGYSYEEAIGKNPKFLKSGEHSEKFYKILWDTILSGEIWYGEFKNKRKSGELYWDKSVISSITNIKGEIEYFIAVQEDITEIKKLATELLKAKEKAEESDKLKTAFLHTMSHEIRTPINAIVGFSEFISNPSLPIDKRAQFAEIIIKSSNQLLSIFTDIVNMATIEAGQEKINETNTDINAIGWLIHEQFLPEANVKNLEFHFIPGYLSESFTIYIDEAKLMQVLTNLVANAIKFTLKGSVVFGYKITGNLIEYYVKDTGIGIPTELHDEIFKRFRQADYSHTRKFGGSGLGLSISKAYIEMLGGEIWFNSEPDKGSEFYFTIPFKEPEGLKIEEEPDSVDFSYKGEHKTILVVEDEESNFFLIQEILKNSNYSIVHAENGAIAVEICRKRDDIDLILMDIRMPVMGGYEATTKIREFYKNIPIIAQTAFIQDYDKQKAIECGITDYIHKPFKIPQLFQLVNNYTNRVRKYNN